MESPSRMILCLCAAISLRLRHCLESCRLVLGYNVVAVSWCFWFFFGVVPWPFSQSILLEIVAQGGCRSYKWGTVKNYSVLCEVHSEVLGEVISKVFEEFGQLGFGQLYPFLLKQVGFE